MWEHAAAVIGIPEAIKASLEIIQYVRSGEWPPDRAHEATNKLDNIKVALENFAVDALELAAYKQLHAITNQFSIDLKESFAMVGPDAQRARAHHSDLGDAMLGEFMSVWEGQRAGSQLARLRDTPKLMRHLKRLPIDVAEKITAPPWDKCFWNLLRKAQSECGNFKNFYATVEELRGLNVALNNYADRQIATGIDEFDSVMERLRIALGRA